MKSRWSPLVFVTGKAPSGCRRIVQYTMFCNQQIIRHPVHSKYNYLGDVSPICFTLELDNPGWCGQLIFPSWSLLSIELPWIVLSKFNFRRHIMGLPSYYLWNHSATHSAFSDPNSCWIEIHNLFKVFVYIGIPPAIDQAPQNTSLWLVHFSNFIHRHDNITPIDDFMLLSFILCIT